MLKFELLIEKLGFLVNMLKRSEERYSGWKKIIFDKLGSPWYKRISHDESSAHETNLSKLMSRHAKTWKNAMYIEIWKSSPNKL